MQHRHRIGAAGDSDQIVKLFLGLAVSYQAIFKPVGQIVLETLIAERLFLDFDCGALDLTLVADFACGSLWFYFGFAVTVFALFFIILGEGGWVH